MLDDGAAADPISPGRHRLNFLGDSSAKLCVGLLFLHITDGAREGSTMRCNLVSGPVPFFIFILGLIRAHGLGQLQLHLHSKVTKVWRQACLVVVSYLRKVCEWCNLGICLLGTILLAQAALSLLPDALIPRCWSNGGARRRLLFASSLGGLLHFAPRFDDRLVGDSDWASQLGPKAS